MSATSQRPPAVAPALPRSLLFDRDYWLMRCEGFTVTAGGRSLGRVEELRFGSRLDRPDSLVVRSRYLPRRRLVVSARDVDDIDPRRRLVSVHGTSDVQERRRWRGWLGRVLAIPRR